VPDAAGRSSPQRGGGRRARDVIALGAGGSLRVVDTRLQEDSDGDPVLVLVVESA
jgi:hypothetical protein